MKDKITSDIDKYLSSLVCCYKKLYNTQHIFTRATEGWKEKLDQEFFCGSILHWKQRFQNAHTITI